MTSKEIADAVAVANGFMIKSMVKAFIETFRECGWKLPDDFEKRIFEKIEIKVEDEVRRVIIETLPKN